MATAIEFLFARIDYERMARVDYSQHREFNLDRTRELLDRLGNPEAGLPIVHIAGTKGKGSTAAMLTAILAAAGYRVGAFTSPHLDRLEERMAVDGRPCSPEELAALVEQVRPAVEAMDKAAEGRAGGIGPTYFEITTAMALVHFARREVDLAVLEVGMGGRLDSTNVCQPRVAVITSISLDHTQQLGDTLAAIAREKAGIIKPGVPVVSGVTEAEPRDVIREACRQRGCRLVELGVDFEFDYRPARHLETAPAMGRIDWRFAAKPQAWREVELALPGRHQAANAAVTLGIVDELQTQGWSIPETAIRRGLAGVAWPGRVQVMARRPAVVIDAAHNVASIKALVKTMEESFSVARRLAVFATTLDKDHRGMLQRLLPVFDEVIFTRYRDNPRSVPAEELEAIAAELTGRRYPVLPDPSDAWDAVHRWARPEDLVCVTGSFFIAADMRRELARRPLGYSIQPPPSTRSPS